MTHLTHLLIQKPPSPPTTGEQARELFLLFHGVGADAADLRSVGQWLAQKYPMAWVVSVQAPHECDLGQGWQWFSVRGVTPQNRAERVAEAMPAFLQAVAGWQAQTGVGAAQTTLVGFSQGAIMSLAATQLTQRVAHRVVAMAGRLPVPARALPAGERIHLLHGDADTVVPTQESIDAHRQFQALQADVTLDLIPGLGHGIDARMMACLAARLGV
jgi:phospholipase/carboxylesterase